MSLLLIKQILQQLRITWTKDTLQAEADNKTEVREEEIGQGVIGAVVIEVVVTKVTEVEVTAKLRSHMVFVEISSNVDRAGSEIIASSSMKKALRVVLVEETEAEAEVMDTVVVVRAVGSPRAIKVLRWLQDSQCQYW